MVSGVGGAVGKRPLVTACLMVRNEEKNLERCLGSLSPLVDEIVVVDTGSTDRTIEIARSFGATVQCTEWKNDFSFHRNQAIEMAHGVWVLIVDADEELLPLDFQDARTQLENASLPEILLVQQMLRYPGGKEIRVLTARMFRKDTGIRFIHPIHEQLNVADGRALLSPFVLVHHGYVTEEGLIQKERRNLAIAKGMSPDDIHGLHCRARSAMSLSDWPEMLEASSRILELGAAPMLEVEASVYAGMAAFNLDRLDEVERYVEKGMRIAPDLPDLFFLRFLSAGKRYERSLEGGDSRSGDTFARPWTFWHDRQQVELVLDVLTGKRRIGGGSIPPGQTGETLEKATGKQSGQIETSCEGGD